MGAEADGEILQGQNPGYRVGAVGGGHRHPKPGDLGKRLAPVTVARVELQRKLLAALDYRWVTQGRVDDPSDALAVDGDILHRYLQPSGTISRYTIEHRLYLGTGTFYYFSTLRSTNRPSGRKRSR